MNQNLQPIKSSETLTSVPTVSSDHLNHQWVLTYGEVNRVVDYLKSDEYIQEIMFDMIQEHRDNQLKKIINQLPEQQRIVIQLRDIEQYEFTEIAKIVEMSESAIRTTLSRARKTIRDSIQQIHNYGIN